MNRGVGTGETGEARASPEIRGCLKSNSQIGKKRNMSGILFFSASPEIILFLRPWSNLIDVADLPTIALDLLAIV